MTAIFRDARARFGSSGAFLYKDFSAMDAMFAPIVTRLETYSIKVDAVSRAYMDAVLSHPAFRARAWGTPVAVARVCRWSGHSPVHCWRRRVIALRSKYNKLSGHETTSQLPFSLCASRLDRSYRKVLEQGRQKHKFAREFVGLTEINPCLQLPVYIEDEVHLWGSNLIVEYLLRTDPDDPADASRPLLSATVTRADHHWQDSKAPIDGSRSAHAAD